MGRFISPNDFRNLGWVIKYFLFGMFSILFFLFQNCSKANFETVSQDTAAQTPENSRIIDSQPKRPEPVVDPGSEPETGLGQPLAGFTLNGNPESTGGATWTYKYTDANAGLDYDLKGNLFKPPGSGPFPALILSHGYGGTPATNNSNEWRGWGLVVISVQYTHAPNDTGLPDGGDGGASAANLLRAHKCLKILLSLGYVNMKRLAAHGHSMGAMLTAALVGAHPTEFVVASHTAGGVNDNGMETAATTTLQAQDITVPYQIHHGTADTVVPMAYDDMLASIFQSRGVDYEYFTYQGYSHNQMKMDATMYSRVKAWYTSHGLFTQ